MFVFCLFVYCLLVCLLQGLLEELQIVRSERDRAVGSSRTLKQTVTALEAEKTQLLTQVCSQLRVPVSQSEARLPVWVGFPGHRCRR